MTTKPMFPAMIVVETYGRVAFPAEMASLILPHLTHFEHKYDAGEYTYHAKDDELKFAIMSAEAHTAVRVRHKLEQANKEGE